MNTIIYDDSVTPGALALSILMAEGGVRENPPGSNRGPEIDRYLRCCGLDPARGRYPWCAAAVTWAVREAGLRLSMLKFRGSASVSNLLARNRALEIPVADARHGDILIHIGDGNHCGFYVRAAPIRSLTPPWEIVSFEGNTLDGMMLRQRSGEYWTHALRVA